MVGMSPVRVLATRASYRLGLLTGWWRAVRLSPRPFGPTGMEPRGRGLFGNDDALAGLRHLVGRRQLHEIGAGDGLAIAALPAFAGLLARAGAAGALQDLVLVGIGVDQQL